MPIPVVCPSCFACMKAPDKAAGRQVKCPKCGSRLNVLGQGESDSLAEPETTPATHPPPEVTVPFDCPLCKRTTQNPPEAILKGEPRCRSCGLLPKFDGKNPSRPPARLPNSPDGSRTVEYICVYCNAPQQVSKGWASEGGHYCRYCGNRAPLVSETTTPDGGAASIANKLPAPATATAKQEENPKESGYLVEPPKPVPATPAKQREPDNFAEHICPYCQASFSVPVVWTKEGGIYCRFCKRSSPVKHADDSFRVEKTAPNPGKLTSKPKERPYNPNAWSWLGYACWVVVGLFVLVCLITRWNYMNSPEYAEKQRRDNIKYRLEQEDAERARQMRELRIRIEMEVERQKRGY